MPLPAPAPRVTSAIHDGESAAISSTRPPSCSVGQTKSLFVRRIQSCCLQGRQTLVEVRDQLAARLRTASCGRRPTSWVKAVKLGGRSAISIFVCVLPGHPFIALAACCMARGTCYGRTVPTALTAHARPVTLLEFSKRAPRNDSIGSESSTKQATLTHTARIAVDACLMSTSCRLLGSTPQTQPTGPGGAGGKTRCVIHPKLSPSSPKTIQGIS